MPEGVGNGVCVEVGDGDGHGVCVEVGDGEGGGAKVPVKIVVVPLFTFNASPAATIGTVPPFIVDKKSAPCL